MTDQASALKSLIQALAVARQTESAAKTVLKVLEDKLKSSTQYLEAKKLLETAKTQTETLRKQIEIHTLDSFMEGNKSPHPAVGIRLCNKISYDTQAALEWAAINSPVMIRIELARELFEKYALEVNGTPKALDFVSIYQEPIVTVSQKLEQYLEPEKDDQEIPF